MNPVSRVQDTIMSIKGRGPAAVTMVRSDRDRKRLFHEVGESSDDAGTDEYDSVDR